MAKPAIQYAAPAIHESVPFEVRRHLQTLYNRIGNHAQAFQFQNDKIAAIKTIGGTITNVISGGGGGGTTIVSNVLIVDNQTGVTSYTTTSGDNGSLLVLNDASPVGVTLAGSTPPYGLFIVNQGTGLVTLTPAAPPTGSSTITYPANPAAASMPILSSYGAIVGFDGSNWWAMTMPIVPGTHAVVAGEYLTGYDASTGLFSINATAGISGTIVIVTAALTTLGTQGSQTFVDGILTAQTPAT